MEENPTGGDGLVDTGKQELGRILRQRRQELGLTQEQLAERAGISQPTYSRLERGDRRPINPYAVQRLAVILGLDPDNLLTIIGLPPLRRQAETPPAALQAEESRNETHAFFGVVFSMDGKPYSATFRFEFDPKSELTLTMPGYFRYSKKGQRESDWIREVDLRAAVDQVLNQLEELRYTHPGFVPGELRQLITTDPARANIILRQSLRIRCAAGRVQQIDLLPPPVDTSDEEPYEQ